MTTEPTTEVAAAFIAHDWCGWNERFGRFTHMPSGDTLVCQGWMGQLDWDKAQAEWFQKFPGELMVHRCPNGAYRETGDTMGTVSEITARLEQRVATKGDR